MIVLSAASEAPEERQIELKRRAGPATEKLKRLARDTLRGHNGRLARPAKLPLTHGQPHRGETFKTFFVLALTSFFLPSPMPPTPILAEAPRGSLFSVAGELGAVRVPPFCLFCTVLTLPRQKRQRRGRLAGELGPWQKRQRRGRLAGELGPWQNRQRRGRLAGELGPWQKRQKRGRLEGVLGPAQRFR